MFRGQELLEELVQLLLLILQRALAGRQLFGQLLPATPVAIELRSQRALHPSNPV